MNLAFISVVTFYLWVFSPVYTLRLPELLELLPSLGTQKREGLSRSVRPTQAQFVDSKLDPGGVMELLFMGFLLLFFCNN